MGLQSSLLALGDGRLASEFDGLRTHIPLEWIRSALAQAGVATVRRRKLLVEQVVWLVIGLSLFRNRPMQEVVHRLDLVMPDKKGRRGQVAKGAIAPARARVGEEPMRALFGLTAERWAVESAGRTRWKGLQLYGGDGSMLRVPDSPENREEYPLHQARGRAAGYPQIRIAAVMALGSHVLWDFAFSALQTGEQALLKPMVERLPEDSLIILDRGYVDGEVFYGVQTGKNRHWLIPAKSTQKWRVIKRLGPNDHRVELSLTYAVRQKHPEWPPTMIVRAIRYQRKGFRARTLLTSLVDPRRYPAQEVAELYHQRWELELGDDEIKTHTLERQEALRSQTPEGVRQELWGLAIAYNLVRREMDLVARGLGISPQRLSFRTSLVLIRDLFIWAATASPGSLPKMIKDMRLDMRQLILPPRRAERCYPREVKLAWSRYNRNNRHPEASTENVLN